MKNLEREVLLKSVELDDDGDDFQFELDDFSTEEEIIAIAPSLMVEVRARSVVLKEVTKMC